jgi:hypothetical protein
MRRPGGYTLAVIVVVAVSVAMGALTAAIAAGALPSGDKGCQPDIEKCPNFIDWHAGIVPGVRVTVMLLVVGLLVVAAVRYVMKQAPPS